MSRSRIAAATVLVIVAATTPAYAATAKKPVVCNLVKDAVGDASVYNAAGGATTYDPSLDIVSADINVNGKMITGVIRVKDLTPESTVAPAGRVWNMSMTTGTTSFGLTAYTSPLGGDRFSRDAGKFDYAKDQIRIHAKIGDFQGLKLTKGTVIRGFYLTSNVVVGFDPAWGAGYGFKPLSGATDSTDPTKVTFTVGSLSCVKVGV